MDVEIAAERIIVLADRFNLDYAEGRAWAKRADAFGAAAKLGGLLNRAGAEDYECVYRERRLQPFWRLHSRAVATYERTRHYTVPVAPEVRTVEIAGETRTIEHQQFRVSGLESCRDETEREFLFNGLTGAQEPGLVTYLGFAGVAVDAAKLAETTHAGTVIVPPQNKASALVREVLASVIGKLEADRILEEKVSVDIVDLVYRPVYAFRYRHAGKEAVIEFDGLTGGTRGDGATFEQYFGKALDPRFLLDVGVEAVNIFVPGAQLARIVVQHGVKKVSDQRKRDS